ncbi:MAG: DUF5067 domain-containing protein [Lachnospiraceae bacterium]|nr:DUF5067 domain-containing protein [Lachnospiraceae bacterium]
MKRRIMPILITTGFLLTACAGGDAQPVGEGVEATAGSAREVTETDEATAEEEAAAEAEAAAAQETEKKEAESETGAPEEEVITGEYFSARIKEFELPDNDDEMMRVVFEFTNITDKTYYKNDEEIAAGASWEKVVSYPLKSWKQDADKGRESWIHYDLYEDPGMKEQIFKGGLSFSVAEDLSVSNMYVFSENE